MTPEERERLEALQRALSEALKERDCALEQLAAARASLAALRSARMHPDEPEAGSWVEAGKAALPLRYRLSDALNDVIKVGFKPLHGRTRGFLGALRRLAR